VCSVNALLFMSYADEGVWAGAGLDEDPQATMEAAEPQQTGSPTGEFSEAVEPQQTGSATGEFSDAELDALTPEEMQVVIEDGRLTDRQLTRALKALGAETTVNAKQVHRQRLLAAWRTQDERARGLGDLIRTYSQIAAGSGPITWCEV